MSKLRIPGQKSDKITESITEHLRSTSRKVLKIDTKDEILKYLSDTFMERLNSDFVAISLIEDNQLVLNNYSGRLKGVDTLFPFPYAKANPLLFQKSTMSDRKELAENSPLKTFFEKKGIDSWFTVPLVDDEQDYGLCIIGYEEATVLYEDMEESFNELGNYVGIALNMIKKNEEKEKKYLNMKRLSNHLAFSGSIKELVERVVTFSGKETKSNYVAVYLLDEEEGSLEYHPPSYGYLRKDHSIPVKGEQWLENYLPYVEEVGHTKISIPIISDMKFLGAIHAEKSDNRIYSGNDLDIFRMYANYFAAMFENMQFTLQEKEQKENLETLLQTQEKLVEETIERNDFDGMNRLLGELASKTIILYDQFLHPISYYLYGEDELTLDQIKEAGKQTKDVENLNKRQLPVQVTPEREFQAFALDGGGTVHGFLALEIEKEHEESLFQLALRMVGNIYSLQFIKQKIERDSKEEVKSTFIQSLLTEEIEDMDRVMEYAGFFSWDLYQPYRIAVLAPEMDDLTKKDNLLAEKTKKKTILDKAINLVQDYDKNILTTVNNDQLILFVPIQSKKSDDYWKQFYRYLLEDMTHENETVEFILGIGGKATAPEEYYDGYQKAIQTLNVLRNSPTPRKVSFFEDLGSYTVLNQIREQPETKTFVKTYLEKIYSLSEGQQVDLFYTLRVYLENNGSIKATSDELFLHRSSLTYRLEKIRDILELDIDDSETRFNLMLAYKLYDLYD